MKQGAIISCSDRTGLAGFARALHANGLQLFASPGTLSALRKEEVPASSIVEYTEQAPGARAKTLQARLHEGIFADPGSPGDLGFLASIGALPITVVCCTLHPLAEAAGQGKIGDWDSLRELLDIGGPALLANAARSYPHVFCIADSRDFADVIAVLDRPRSESMALRKRLAVKAMGILKTYYAAAEAQMELVPCP